MRAIPTETPVIGANYSFTATTTVSTTILAGATTSGAVDMTTPNLAGFAPIAFFVPVGWTSAKMSLDVSLNGSTWFLLHFADKDFVTKTIAGGETLIDPTYLLRGFPYFRIRSGTSAAPVTQVSAVTLVVLCGTV